jgi:NAD+ diphosphatase
MIPFTGNPLNRASEKRGDAAWVESRRRAPSTFILPLWRQQPFLLGPETARGRLEVGFLRPGLAEALTGPEEVSVLLGLDGDDTYFALDISAARDPANEGPLAGLGHFRDMRACAPLLTDRDVAIVGQAKAMTDWHQRHGFCAACGTPTRFADAGYKRVCDACRAEHFPRTDPVAIMLATDGDHCLVGHGKLFPAGFFSALAGFIEPGETIEEAVRRELFEEAGLRTGRVTYHATQPWPFPSSLMIGCFAEALSRDLVLDETEITEARWLSRADALAILAGDRSHGLFLPPPFAIAHHLIRNWAEGNAAAASTE